MTHQILIYLTIGSLLSLVLLALMHRTERKYVETAKEQGIEEVTLVLVLRYVIMYLTTIIFWPFIVVGLIVAVVQKATKGHVDRSR